MNRTTVTRGSRSATARLVSPARAFGLSILAIAAWVALAPGPAAAETAAGSRSDTAVALLAPSDAAFKCAAAKQKAALRRLNAISACLRRPPQLGGQNPNPLCIENAQARFEREYAGIEARGGCLPMTGDEPLVASIADECALKLTIALPGTCQPAGELCGGSNPPCCDGLVCRGVIGQLPRCG